MKSPSIFDFHGYAKSQEMQPQRLPEQAPRSESLNVIVSRLLVAGGAIASLALQPKEGNQ